MKTAAVLIGDVRTRGWGICPLPSSPQRGIWQFKCPHPPGNLPSKRKKCYARGLARGGGAWAQLDLTDALLSGNNGDKRIQVSLKATKTQLQSSFEIER